MKKSERNQLLILEMKQAIEILEGKDHGANLHNLLLSIRKNSIQVDKNSNQGYWNSWGEGEEEWKIN